MVDEGAARKATKTAARKATARGASVRPAPTIQDLLRQQEARMRADLALNRATFRHLGNRGEGVESAGRAFFASHLPRQLSIGTGEIIDSEGRRSGQVDVAISNLDQPFTGDRDTPCLHFAEGVSAVCEVKSKLTTTALNEALGTAQLVKLLQPKPQVGDQIFTNSDDRARFYEAIPFFVLAFEQSLRPETVAKKISMANWVTGKVDGVLTPFPLIDAVFILGKGALIYFRKGEAFAFKSTRADDFTEGWVFIETDTTLVQMLTWLNAVMPRVIRYRPVTPLYLMGQTTTVYHLTNEVLGIRPL
jgi:Domain of unknown function (DUF6602)